MNRLSTEGVVLQLISILILFVCVSGGRSSVGSSMVCEARGGLFVCLTVFPGHTFHTKGLLRQLCVGTLINSQQWRALAVFSLSGLKIPGHALHEKGLQRQIGVGTLVNSQQRRALAVPVINRWWTAGQPRVNRGFCSSTGFPDMPCMKRVYSDK